MKLLLIGFLVLTSPTITVFAQQETEAIVLCDWMEGLPNDVFNFGDILIPLDVTSLVQEFIAFENAEVRIKGKIQVEGISLKAYMMTNPNQEFATFQGWLRKTGSLDSFTVDMNALNPSYKSVVSVGCRLNSGL